MSLISTLITGLYKMLIANGQFLCQSKLFIYSSQTCVFCSFVFIHLTNTNNYYFLLPIYLIISFFSSFYTILILFVFIGHETMLAVTSLESQNQFFPSVILREQSDLSISRHFPVL